MIGKSVPPSGNADGSRLMEFKTKPVSQKKKRNGEKNNNFYPHGVADRPEYVIEDLQILIISTKYDIIHPRHDVITWLMVDTTDGDYAEKLYSLLL